MSRLTPMLLALLALPTASWLAPAPLVRARATGAARAAVYLQEDEPGYTKGINPILGGGKSAGDVEKSALAVNGSKAAFAVVFALLVFGATNEDKVGEFAKSSKKPCVNKIVNGKKIVCDEVASAAALSPFPVA
jgi:hypothetical protein